MALLCTGYEPFGEHETNPSGDVARALDGARLAGHDVVGEVLPVAFEDAGDRMRALLDEHDPVAVVATGLAAGRSGVSVERVAVNAADAVGVPDNAGDDPVDERIDPDGRDGYLATVPVRRTVEACLDAGVPARLSNTAGTHLCNHLLYWTLAHLDATGRDAPAGFLHLPATPGQAARKAQEGEAARGGSLTPSLPLELSERAVGVAFEIALERAE
ncbi:peptidase [Halorarum halophilum]|uniref:Pyroglutamyl-peptidase I n=1 Tax=Halorarum halophilum TaxID=2743090 RepID=A0A7D5GC10_9EURY|nr:peptidase [Halobaculum halophilum]QLG27912.1 peptidase [Halobaculum halophilum]